MYYDEYAPTNNAVERLKMIFSPQTGAFSEFISKARESGVILRGVKILVNGTWLTTPDKPYSVLSLFFADDETALNYGAEITNRLKEKTFEEIMAARRARYPTVTKNHAMMKALLRDCFKKFPEDYNKLNKDIHILAYRAEDFALRIFADVRKEEIGAALCDLGFETHEVYSSSEPAVNVVLREWEYKQKRSKLELAECKIMEIAAGFLESIFEKEYENTLKVNIFPHTYHGYQCGGIQRED